MQDFPIRPGTKTGNNGRDLHSFALASLDTNGTKCPLRCPANQSCPDWTLCPS